jgi:hypothetical protein
VRDAVSVLVRLGARVVSAEGGLAFVSGIHATLVSVGEGFCGVFGGSMLSINNKLFAFSAVYLYAVVTYAIRSRLVSLLVSRHRAMRQPDSQRTARPA